VPRNNTIKRWQTAAAAALISFFPLILSPSAALHAEDVDPRSIEEVQRALDQARERQRELAQQAEAQIREIELLRAQLSEAAASTQESEANLSAIETRLAGLEAEEAVKTAELEARREELAVLLGALQRLARHPPEALLLLPASPIDTVRAARLLGTMVPQIEGEARQIARDVENLQGLREIVAAEREALTGGGRRLTGDREHLRELMARRAQIYQQTESERAEAAERVEALSRQAEDLRDLLARLAETKAAEKQAAESRHAASLQAPSLQAPSLQAQVAQGLAGRLRRLGEAHGQMAFPARGRIVLAFGQTGEGGQPHRGVSIETRPEAQVVAPFDGQIVFAGPFRGYGRILIIEHGEGYHTLLAGLGRIDVSAGQVVATGEPIATTSSADTGLPEVRTQIESQNLGALGPVLYVELRRRGQPINPLPWLATSNGKVSG
jgi:septal ring factor EnvC (AmiA/AmiB activator)